MALSVAGALPGSQDNRVIVKLVTHHYVEFSQRIQAALKPRINGRRRRDVRLCGVMPGADGLFKLGYIGFQVGEKIVRQFKLDELRRQRRGIGYKGARGIQQRLIAAAVRHAEFVTDRRLINGHRPRRAIDDREPFAQGNASAGLAGRAFARRAEAGDLRGGMSRQLGNRRIEFGKQLPAKRGGWKVSLMSEGRMPLD